MKIRLLLSNIAAISPRSLGVLIVMGGWEPIYHLAVMLGIFGPGLGGFFILSAIVCSALFFAFDYWKLRRKRES